jgi:hypothetical protein
MGPLRHPADDYSTLPRRERVLVCYAREAVRDTYNGTARMLTRAKRSPVPEALDVVSAVYSASSGRVPSDLDAWECGECGTVHYGIADAGACCGPDLDDFADLDDEQEDDDDDAPDLDDDDEGHPDHERETFAGL